MGGDFQIQIDMLGARLATLESTVRQLSGQATGQDADAEWADTSFATPLDVPGAGGGGVSTWLRGGQQPREEEVRGHVRITSAPDSAVVATAVGEESSDSDSDSDSESVADPEVVIGVYYV